MVNVDLVSWDIAIIIKASLTMYWSVEILDSDGSVDIQYMIFPSWPLY